MGKQGNRLHMACLDMLNFLAAFGSREYIHGLFQFLRLREYVYVLPYIFLDL